MGQHRRILVIDDEENVLLVLHDALVRLGEQYEVETARDGREALDRLSAQPFDLIITDIKMPGMNGVELTEATRTLCPDTAVIWMTAYGYHEVRDTAAQLKIYRCLEKPVEIAEICQAVREALEATAG